MLLLIWQDGHLAKHAKETLPSGLATLPSITVQKRSILFATFFEVLFCRLCEVPHPMSSITGVHPFSWTPKEVIPSVEIF